MTYLIGIIKKIFNNELIIENNKIGYKIYTYKCNKFIVGQRVLIYIYEIIDNNHNILVGIHNSEEYEFFNHILKLNGVGYKTAIRFLNSMDYKNLIDILTSNNIDKLSDFLKINDNIKKQLKNWK